MGASIIVTVVAAIDLLVRGNELFSEMRPRDWVIYLLGCGIEVLLLWGIFTVALWLGRWRWPFVILFAFLYSFTIVAVYEFYKFFHCFPGIYSFHAIFDQPEEALALSAYQFNWAVTGKTLGLGGLVILGANMSRKESKFKQPIFGIFAFFFTVANMVPLRPPAPPQMTYPTFAAMVVSREGRALPFAHTVVCMSLGLMDHLTGKVFHSGLQKRTAPSLSPAGRSADRSALLIITESVRRQNLSLFGYKRKTTPGMDSFKERHGESFITYPRGFSNATLTSVSVSFLLSGLSPEVGIDRLQKANLVHEVIGTLDHIKTAYITSWSYVPSRYQLFLNTKILDWFYCQETDNSPLVCDVGTDDAIIPDQLSSFLDTVPENEHFFAVLHFSNTHYPYYSSGEGAWNKESPLDQYDNSILYQDKQVSRVLKILEERGRLKETMVLYTSDHGEGFGVERPVGHAGLRDVFSVGVPTWIFAPENSRFAGVGDRLRQASLSNICNSDLVSTILEYFGFDPQALGMTRPGLLSVSKEVLPIYIYDWRLGFGESGKDYLGIISGDYLLNVIHTYGKNSYRLSNIDSPKKSMEWSLAQDSLKSGFISAIRRYKGLNKFAPTD